MRRVAWYTAVVLATLTVLILLWQFRDAIVLFLLSLAVAAAVRPIIEYFAERGVPRIIALLLSFFLIILIIVGLIVISSGPIVHELETASNNLAATYEHIKTQWPQTGNSFQKGIANQLPPPADLYNSLTGSQGAEFLQALLGITLNFFSFITNFIIILILSLYWSLDYVRFERLWLSLIPADKRPRAREVWRAIEKGVGAYIRSEVIQSILAWIFLWMGYYVIGLNYPAVLAAIGALAWLIPWFGGVIALILPFLVGLAISPAISILAVAYTLLILIIMEKTIEPRFFPHQPYSSVLLVLVALAMAEVFGLIGLILAPVLSAAIQISFRHLFQPPAAQGAVVATSAEQQPGIVNVASLPIAAQPAAVRSNLSAPGVIPSTEKNSLSTNGEDQEIEMEKEIELLQERLAKAKDMLKNGVEEPSPGTTNLIDRLNQLINNTNEALFVSHLVPQEQPIQQKEPNANS